MLGFPIPLLDLNYLSLIQSFTIYLASMIALNLCIRKVNPYSNTFLQIHVSDNRKAVSYNPYDLSCPGLFLSYFYIVCMHFCYLFMNISRRREILHWCFWQFSFHYTWLHAGVSFLLLFVNANFLSCTLCTPNMLTFIPSICSLVFN